MCTTQRYVCRVTEECVPPSEEDRYARIDDIPSFAADLLNADFDCAADMNGDQSDDGADVSGFVAAILNP